MKFSERLKSAVLLDNPVFMQTIGLCPALATTTSLSNAIGMGAAATVVLICSNIVISLLRKFIPEKVRIAAFITIIAGFVTIIDLSLQAFVSAYDNMGRVWQMGSESLESRSLGTLETTSLKMKQPFLMSSPDLFYLPRMGHSSTPHEAHRIKR